MSRFGFGHLNGHGRDHAYEMASDVVESVNDGVYGGNLARVDQIRLGNMIMRAVEDALDGIDFEPKFPLAGEEPTEVVPRGPVRILPSGGARRGDAA